MTDHRPKWTPSSEIQYSTRRTVRTVNESTKAIQRRNQVVYRLYTIEKHTIKGIRSLESIRPMKGPVRIEREIYVDERDECCRAGWNAGWVNRRCDFFSLLFIKSIKCITQIVLANIKQQVRVIFETSRARRVIASLLTKQRRVTELAERLAGPSYRTLQCSLSSLKRPNQVDPKLRRSLTRWLWTCFARTADRRIQNKPKEEDLVVYIREWTAICWGLSNLEQNQHLEFTPRKKF